MISGQFAISLHILTLLATSDDYLSSDYIAGSLNVNPVLVRKEISNLKKHALVESKEGKNGGTKLLKPAADITLDDIYKITHEKISLGFSKNTPNPDCPIGKKITENLGSLYDDLDHVVSKQLGHISLLNFMETF